MPIAKIPVVHNFGIISRTHQEEIKQKILEKEDAKRHKTKSPNFRSTQESNLNLRYTIENILLIGDCFGMGIVKHILI